MFRNENYPNVAGANFPHVGGVNVPHQPMMMPYSYASPAYDYCPPHRNTFALIVVLFILLIIIGASFYSNKC
jgi:uncharacterized protein (TIGR01732 family)